MQQFLLFSNFHSYLCKYIRSWKWLAVSAQISLAQNQTNFFSFNDTTHCQFSKHIFDVYIFLYIKITNKLVIPVIELVLLNNFLYFANKFFLIFNHFYIAINPRHAVVQNADMVHTQEHTLKIIFEQHAMNFLPSVMYTETYITIYVVCVYARCAITARSRRRNCLLQEQSSFVSRGSQSVVLHVFRGRQQILYKRGTRCMCTPPNAPDVKAARFISQSLVQWACALHEMHH